MSAGIEEAEQPGTRPVARVLLDSALPQLDHLFDYAIPPELQESLRVGHRVRVPFRSKDRKSFGYVIEFVDRSEFGGELSPIADVVSPVPLLTPEVWRLARAVADRAGGSAGDILRLAIPTRMVRVEKQHLAAAAEVDAAEADATAAAEEGAAGGDAAEGHPGVDVRADGAVGAESTEDAGDAEDSEDSDDSANSDVVADSVHSADSVGSAGSTSSVKFTVSSDSADSVASADSSSPAGSTADVGASASASALAPEAEVARELVTGARLALTASHGPERLHTGEWVGGWAAQLARIAIAVFDEGRSVICAVPDWRDLDQLRDALAAFGHESAVRVDSRQSNGERYAGFLRALDHEPRIILGNRSAVYAPAHQLGAILMWDDGDSVLAEPLAPYVHARDAALVRAGQAGAGLFFAAHSRSAEVQRLADIGYVRAQHNPPRRTRVVHADASMTPDVFAGRLPEIAARTIREALKDGPVLVQVATPGYAPIAVCNDCGELARCRACAGPIGFRAAQRAACRWCGTNAVSWQCPECDGRHLAERGMGSERTVEQFERQFAGARVLLSDGEHARERVDARPALVVATRGAEPIAAGGYRAVVLLDAERLLARESLRSAEDCVRWWENAAALAAPDGHCLLAAGGGPAVRAFVTGRTEEWLHSELGDRHELRYPPAVRVASVTGGHTEVNRALDTLAGLAGVDHLGPTPLPAGGPAKTPAGLMRAIVRFDYARGGEVAARLRGALVADAAGATSRTKARAPGRARPEALRLRFDDRGVFEG